MRKSRFYVKIISTGYKKYKVKNDLYSFFTYVLLFFIFD